MHALIEVKQNVYYTLEETADVLRVSRSAVRRLLQNGQINGIKVGRQWRILGRNLLQLPDIESKQPASTEQSIHEMTSNTIQKVWDNDEDSIYDQI